MVTNPNNWNLTKLMRIFNTKQEKYLAEMYELKREKV